MRREVACECCDLGGKREKKRNKNEGEIKEEKRGENKGNQRGWQCEDEDMCT
jgi:hypothetical protein